MKTTPSAGFNFTMFFDGACPICNREVRMLRRKDKHNKIQFIDTSAVDFDAAKFGISSDPNRLIHGMMSDGTIVRGMEVFRQVYREIGMGWLLAPTGWPLLRPFFDLAYRIFARNRISIGKLFGRSCETAACDVDKKKA